MDARIVAAATQLFLDQGVAATSCEAVAARARVGKASLYARYSGKDALFEAVVRHAVESTARQPALRHHASGNLASRLAASGRAVISDALSPTPLALMRLFLTEAPRNRELIVQVDQMARARVVDMIVHSILEEDGDDEKQQVTRDLADRFLDLTFSPIMLAALAGHTALTSPEAIDRRIDFALAMLRGAGLLGET